MVTATIMCLNQMKAIPFQSVSFSHLFSPKLLSAP